MYRVAATIVVLGITVCSGCANMGVEPWERDLLARPDMELVSDPVQAGVMAVMAVADTATFNLQRLKKKVF